MLGARHEVGRVEKTPEKCCNKVGDGDHRGWGWW